MHILIGILGIIGGIYYFLIRAQNARDMAGELADAAGDVKAAARRFGYRFRNNVHPVDAVEDPKVLASTIVLGFLDLDDFPTKEQRDSMMRQAQSEYDISLKDAEELCVLARWLITQCKGADAAISRASRAMFKLGGPEDAGALLRYLNGTLSAGGRGLSETQKEALQDVQNNLRLR